MKKKQYVKPTLQVYELKHQAQLMAGSEGNGGGMPGGEPGIPIWLVTRDKGTELWTFNEESDNEHQEYFLSAARYGSNDDNKLQQ